MILRLLFRQVGFMLSSMSHEDPSVKHTPKRRGPRGIQTNHAELKRLRIAAGLTLDELADRADTSKSFLSQVENERYNAGHALTFRLAAALGCDPAALMDGHGDN